jgi:uncharacterized membrane protein
MINFESDALHWIDLVITGIEILAVIIIVITIAAATIQFVFKRIFRKGSPELYHKYRVGLARAILLGLEVLIAADVIRTVVLDLTFQSIAILGLLVVVRTFLSWSLEVEIDRRWPWQPKNRNQSDKDEET